MILVTGGCGFIGSNFINYMVRKYQSVHFINLDKMDYCANGKNITVSQEPNYHFVKGDISDGYLVLKILNQYKIHTVIHFAAYSHVDNSFDNSVEFTKNNVVGTHQLLESCRIWGQIERFIHVSTDEVYGEVHDGSCTEETVLAPTNPYAASKAAAEMLVRAYMKSFNLPAIITRGNNVYGPRQYPEKLIPKFITLALNGQPLTIHGKGKAKRTFIHVDDVVTAFETIIFKGKIGEIYNIGSSDEHSVMDIAQLIRKNIISYVGYDEVEDRAFNDIRYSINSQKLVDLGWSPKILFEDGFVATIEWYKKNSQHFI